MRAKSILKSVRDVRACGSFLGVGCATALLHTFQDKMTRFHVLEHPFPVLESPLRTAYSDLEVENPKNLQKVCAVCRCEVRPP